MTSESQIRAIAGGDRAAFAALYKRLSPVMQRYATGLLAGDCEAAEDVVDEAFTDIWRKAGSYSGSGHADGWIRRIVHNKAVDWLRKRRESVGIDDDMMASHHAALECATSPEDELIHLSEATWLRRALCKLSVEHREAVWLCYFEEKPLAEIALIAGCPENTVKTRLYHARRVLKQQLA